MGTALTRLKAGVGNRRSLCRWLALLGATALLAASGQAQTPESGSASASAPGATLYSNRWGGASGQPVITTSPVLSDGRFNSMLGLGILTAYSTKSRNHTLMISGAVATALAYQKWSRKRERQRAHEGMTVEEAYGEREYEYRKGRGETALALSLLPAYGLAHKNNTYLVFGGVAALLAYGRYRETRRDAARWQSRHPAATASASPTPPASP
jgi:hypothetical protein